MSNSTKSKVRSFRDLLVWQQSLELVIQTYRLTEVFPRREMYGIVAQIRGAAVSIPANIAEGHARSTTKDYLRFLGIATGSLREFETYCEISKRLEYASQSQMAQIAKLANSIGAMLARLCFTLRGKRGDRGIREVRTP